MALPPLAEINDLAAWVGQDIPDGSARAVAVLSAASSLVRAEVGQTWTDDGGNLTAVPDEVAVVVVQVAARVWINPAGLQLVTADDGTRRWGEGSQSGLFLTDTERAILARHRTTASSGLGVLSTTRGEEGDRTVYVPTGPPPSGYPFPWYDADEWWQ